MNRFNSNFFVLSGQIADKLLIRASLKPIGQKFKPKLSVVPVYADYKVIAQIRSFFQIILIHTITPPL